MAAPATVNVHGTADAVHDIADEPSGTPVLDVSEFKFAATREKRMRKNRHGNTRRVEYFEPLLAMSLTAGIIALTSSSLAVAHPGTLVTSLANFGAERRGFDPAVGSIILEDCEDTLSLEEDTTTSMNFTHYPFVNQPE